MADDDKRRRARQVFLSRTEAKNTAETRIRQIESQLSAGVALSAIQRKRLTDEDNALDKRLKEIGRELDVAITAGGRQRPRRR